MVIALPEEAYDLVMNDALDRPDYDWISGTLTALEWNKILPTPLIVNPGDILLGTRSTHPEINFDYADALKAASRADVLDVVVDLINQRGDA